MKATTTELDTAARHQAYKAEITRICTDLRLSGFRSRYDEVCQDPQWEQLPLAHQLYDLLSHEEQRRQINTGIRLRRKSNLPTDFMYADFKDVWDRPSRKWDKKVLSIITNGEWMLREQPSDLAIIGPCGCGKTYLAACCANYMINHRCEAYFIRSANFFEELRVYKEANELEARKKRLKEIGLLVLDDFLLEDMKPEDTGILLDIIISRRKHKATVFTSQYRLDGWVHRLGMTPLAQAFVDRIQETAYQLHIDGPSLREEPKIG